MKNITRKIRRGVTWSTTPENQDLQTSRSGRLWAERTACCKSKKGWKANTANNVFVV
ncbi:hypothetical protein [Pseudocitrobacter cyperus]|uniref:Uncharacterized protein n=1 Tax=Pseudocitrobacter cyperus TaxID=3112843 RepID=A0ABV0HDY1_9ENTR